MNDKRLGERYRLVRPLGCGGMASVWEADDGKLKRRVAVKVLSGRHAGRHDALARFERECMAVARLRSPHIVQVYDYGIDGGRPFMVMELLAGETLSERLRKLHRLEWARVAILARHLGKALATAHEAGIVHRDLKPGNVFLVRDHQDEIVKVFDFGISKALDLNASLTHDAVLGTPSFMSPEQMRDSSEVDARSDLWSFGVILYRACTGRLPFTGSDLKRLIGAVVKAPVPPVSDATLPTGIDGFFARALAKEPEDRFSSALEMAEAFEALAHRRPLAVLPPPEKPSGHMVPPPPERKRATPPPPPRRKPKLPPPLPTDIECPPLEEEPATVLYQTRAEEITMSVTRTAVSETRWALVASAAVLFVTGIAVTVLQTESATSAPVLAHAGLPIVDVPIPRVAPVLPKTPPPRPKVVTVKATTTPVTPVATKDLFEEPW